MAGAGPGDPQLRASSSMAYQIRPPPVTSYCRCSSAAPPTFTTPRALSADAAAGSSSASKRAVLECLHRHTPSICTSSDSDGGERRLREFGRQPGLGGVPADPLRQERSNAFGEITVHPVADQLQDGLHP